MWPRSTCKRKASRWDAPWPTCAQSTSAGSSTWWGAATQQCSAAKAVSTMPERLPAQSPPEWPGSDTVDKCITNTCSWKENLLAVSNRWKQFLPEPTLIRDRAFTPETSCVGHKISHGLLVSQAAHLFHFLFQNHSLTYLLIRGVGGHPLSSKTISAKCPLLGDAWNHLAQRQNIFEQHYFQSLLPGITISGKCT